MSNKVRIKLPFAILFLACTLTAQIKVGFLTINDSASKNAEIEAAYDFLKTQNRFYVKTISSNDITNSQSNLATDKFSIIWIHLPDSSSKVTDLKLIKALQNFVESGGKLFLTLDAVKLLNELGIESHPIQISHTQAIDDGYGRKLGLHAFRSHPIFNGLNGGAYIFSPYNDQTVRQLGFFDQTIPDGKVIAIDWAYITFKENSKIVIEYSYGKGKVLAVGAYTNYSMKNWNKAHLELFTKNCFDYLFGKFDNEKKYFWNYKPNKVISFDSNEKNNLVLNNAKTSKWKIKSDELKITQATATNNYWNVAGQRMLVMGKEKGGIDEIWAHPFMALRDYEVGIVEKDSICWLKNLVPRVIVCDQAFIRYYNIDRKKLTEIITASIKNPNAVIHYEYKGDEPIKLVVKFKSNLRFMWPYSEKVLGSIYFNFDKNLNSFIVKDESGDFVTLVGSNKKPIDKIIGQFDSFDWNKNNFNGNTTDKFQISALQTFELKYDDSFDIVISATNEGLSKTTQEFSKTISNPEKVFSEAANYTKEFFDNALMIKTPDKNFNDGYRWSLIGTDRFFVNTPGVGNSFAAGYSTTERGWDGGHKVNGRPGYGWYFGRDGCWSGFAVLDYGDFEKVKSMIEFFNKYQDLSGKIFHELTTSGAVHYDASDSTPLYIILAGQYLLHSGDSKFIKENWAHIKRAIDFCFSTDTDGDHLIENTNVGHGWVEGGGLYTAHTEVYLAACWAEALKQASYMADKVGLIKNSKKYFEEYQIVKNIIDKNFWNNKVSYLSFSKLKDGNFNPEKTVLAAVPVYFDMLDSVKSKTVVNAFSENYFSSDWGVRILREDSPIFNPRGYHTGSVWPLFTGWTALAEYKNGNYVQGYSHIMNNLLVYKNWQLGFVEEVLNGAEYKPGGVCPHQCWSETMVLQPIIEGMLGLEIDAAQKRLKMSPHLPADWDFLKVEKIRIGNSFVNFEMHRKEGKYFYNFKTSSLNPIQIEFSPSFTLGTELVNIAIKGKPATMKQNNNTIIDLTISRTKSSHIEIEYKNGISVLPLVVEPRPNDVSKGFRILADGINKNNYFIEVQGLSGSKNQFQVYSERKITSVGNGNIINEQNSIYTISTELEKSFQKYINKTIEMFFK